MISPQNLIKNTVLKQKNNLMIKGTVKKFDTLNGWGFIEDYEGNDYFFNVSNVKMGLKLREGMNVKFDSFPGQRGDEAENISSV